MGGVRIDSPKPAGGFDRLFMLVLETYMVYATYA